MGNVHRLFTALYLRLARIWSSKWTVRRFPTHVLLLPMVFLVVWGTLTERSLAQDQAAPSGEYLLPKPNDDAVKAALNAVLLSLDTAWCAPEKACAPITPEELANPPVSLDRARKTMRLGFVSGLAEWCGLDWADRVFLPMMSYFRHEERVGDRQAALLSRLHGVGQGQVQLGLEGLSCSAEYREAMVSLLTTMESPYWRP